MGVGGAKIVFLGHTFKLAVGKKVQVTMEAEILQHFSP